MLDSLFNPSAMMNNFFRKVDNAVWDIQTGSLGLRTKEGIHTLSGEGDTAQIILNPITQFGLPLPAFARSTPLAAVKLGDMVSGSVNGWVVSLVQVDGVTIKFKILKANGETTTWAPPKMQMLGFDSGVMIVTSLLNLSPGGSAGLGNLQSSLLPLMMMGGEDLDMDSLMPMLLMGGQFGSSTDAASTNGLSGLVSTFMFMSMMKKFGGSKSGGSLFKSFSEDQKPFGGRRQ